MIQTKTSRFLRELVELQDVISKVLPDYQKISEDHSLRGIYAEWHLKGLVYHARTIINNYDKISAELLTRLNSLGKMDIFIMHTPVYQNLMFEFYAFVNLAKISLDNLRYILYPLFITSTNQMPKSISGMESSKTDCSVYERVAKTKEIKYLIDLRNCLVHYRTFATDTNSMVVLEGTDLAEIEKLSNGWTNTMAKGMYRITQADDVVFNIYIPDQIFEETSGGKKLAHFKYESRINITAETMRFLRQIAFNYLESLALNIHSQEKRYNYNKNGGIGPVDFKVFNF
jgi:hypothetical protein